MTPEHPPQEEPTSECQINATEAAQGFLNLFLRKSPDSSLPETTSPRQQLSTADRSLDSDKNLPDKVLHPPIPAAEDQKPPPAAGTVLYLAYGSNLSSKTFLGTRGIKPLSQINVLVPELRLTFDMPGFPYLEPCFAATQFRTKKDGEADAMAVMDDENTPLQQDYHKERWHKPLVGVVYEVSLSDYARIIATEGGGRGYKDIVVDCYPFPKSYRPSDPVPVHPDTRPLKAHSLLSPAAEKTLKGENPGVRPNPGHAQPSARYLKLVNTGAAEHDLPDSYRAYLAQIRPYRITTARQEVGKFVFAVVWAPLMLGTLALTRVFSGPDGRSPRWLIVISDLLYLAMWRSYDTAFLRLFGEGERTIGDT